MEMSTSKRTPSLPAWLLWLSSVVAAGFILISHGCHGNEDTELLVNEYSGERRGVSTPCEPQELSDS